MRDAMKIPISLSVSAMHFVMPLLATEIAEALSGTKTYTEAQARV